MATFWSGVDAEQLECPLLQGGGVGEYGKGPIRLVGHHHLVEGHGGQVIKQGVEA